MTGASGVALVTGAAGYLGSRIADALERDGWRVTRLVRSPEPSDSSQLRFDLQDPMPAATLGGDLLVHAAYDFAARRRQDVWRVNVGGSRRLLRAAREGGMGRIIVLSTMSAYEGTSQIYGTAKLAIERETAAVGGLAVRPGLVYGPGAGGMFAALHKAVCLPLVPLMSPGARQFPVHEDDLVGAIVALARADDLPPGPVGIAQRTPITFREILEAIAAAEGRRCRFVPVHWRMVYGALRAAEILGVRAPFRADSLLGLVRPAPFVPNPDALDRLGIPIRSFSLGAAA